MQRILPLAAALLAWPVAAAAPPYPEAKNVPIALLVDLSSRQVLFARNEAQPFLPASVTKVMTALVAFVLIDSDKLKEDQRIAVRPETLARWRGKGTTMPLAPGDEPTVGQLLTGITTVSANDAAVVLAEGVAGSVEGWSGLMNATAKRIGMTGSHFATPNGWPDEGRTVVTARDLVLLSEEMITRHPQLYRRYIGRPGMSWHGVDQRNHDPTLGIVPGADGIKTGHTFEAGYNFLGSAQRGNRRLVVVVAGSWIPESRANAARELLEWGFAGWDSRPLVGAGERVGEARVQGGASRAVGLTVPRTFALALPKGRHPTVTTRIRYAGPLTAPIARGTPVAQLQVEVDGRAPYSLPLIAAESVGKAGPLDRLVNGLAGLVG